MAKELRVGMLGAGFIGSFHSYALKLQPFIKTPPEAPIRIVRVADVSEKARSTLQAAFVYRFVPALRYARQLVQEGAIGDVTHFRSQYLMSNYLQPGLDFSWRLDKKIAGTGTFGDLGAHHIDLARYL